MTHDVTSMCFFKLLRYLEEKTKFTSIEHRELSKYLDPSCIDTLLRSSILERKITATVGKAVEEDDKILVIEEVKRDKVILRDRKTLEVTEKQLSEFIEYRVIPKTFVKQLSSIIFEGNLGVTEILERESFYDIIITFNRINIRLLLQKVPFPSVSGRVIEIARSVRARCPILLVTTSKAFHEFLEYFALVALGSLIYVTTYGQLSELGQKEDRKLGKEIRDWVDYMRYVINLEEEILREVSKYRKFKDLLVSVDTNPKYLITALNLFRSIRRIGLKSRRSYELLEDLVAIALPFIYGGDPFHYGYKRRGEELPDSVFVVWRPEDEASKVYLIGLVDAKSTDLKLSKIDVPKYLGYIKRIRRLPWTARTALFFVPLNSCEEVVRRYRKCPEGKGLRSFYNELARNLKKDEYVVILPLDSLITLVDTYLSTIRRIGLGRGRSGIHDIFRLVMSPTPSNPAMIRLGDKLFCVCSEKLRSYIKRKTKERWIESELRRAFSGM